MNISEKQKAQELLEKYFQITMNMNLVDGGKQRAKDAAAIYISDMIAELNQLHKPEYTTFILKYAEFKEGTTEKLTPAHLMDGYEKLSFWETVEAEIEKL